MKLNSDAKHFVKSVLVFVIIQKPIFVATTVTGCIYLEWICQRKRQPLLCYAYGKP